MCGSMSFEVDLLLFSVTEMTVSRANVWTLSLASCLISFSLLFHFKGLIIFFVIS